MRRGILAAAIVLMATSASAQPYSPPAGSPAADAEWPRLIVTQDNRAAIRTYIDTYYETRFQAFLDSLASPPASNDLHLTVLNQFGPMNYAFPVALGVSDLQALGYTFPAAYDTDAELCSAAYTMWSTDVTSGSGTCTAGAPCRGGKYQLENSGTGVRSFDRSQSISQPIMKSSVTWYYIPSILMFDWCHAALSTGQKQAIADAFYEAYTEYWSGENLISTTKTGTTLATTSSSFPFVADDVLFGLTAWGDTDILDSTKRQTLFDTFYTLYPLRYFWELGNKWPEGWNPFYGSDYWAYTVGMSSPINVTMINTALGTTGTPQPYLANYKQFTEIGSGLAAWTHPDAIGKTATGCGASGTAACFATQEPWGDNTFGMNIATSQIRAVLLSTGFLRFWGYTDEANWARWQYQNLTRNTQAAGPSDPDTSTLISDYPWATTVFFHFLFGTAGTTATTPTKLNATLGWHYNIFRKDYTVDDTYVFFGAQPWLTGGHDSKELGSFSLRKFGPLVLSKAGNWREGDCRYDQTAFSGNNLMHSSMGIHKGATGAGMYQDGGVNDADFVTRGITSAGTVAATTPLKSFGTSHSYVSYDGTQGWSSATATKYQREFTYLRGSTDHEYLVILDRVVLTDFNGADNIAGTSDDNDPVWKAWVTAQPAIVDGSQSNPSTGKWTTTGKTVSVTNAHTYGANFGSPSFTRPAAHAKMFLKALLPADAEIQWLGDDGTGTKTVMSGNNDGTAVTMLANCVAGHYDLYGWGRIEIRPGTVGADNTFMTVLQFGDSNSLSTMADTVVADVLTPGWVVAAIADTVQNRVVAMAKDASAPGVGPSYRFAQSTPTAHNLVVNLTPGRMYFVDSGRSVSALVGPVGVLTVPVLAWPVLRRRRRVRVAVVVLALFSTVGLYRWTAAWPATMTVSVTTTPNGTAPHVADQGGAIAFETER